MRHLLLVVSLLVSTMLTAAPVSRQAASRKAAAFMAEKTGQVKNLQHVRRQVRRAASVSQEPFYIFNQEGGGFVIVSGDDRTEEIIGYSATGSIDVDAIPENMRSFLQLYADEIQYLDNHDVQSKQRTALHRATRTAIAPLVQTFWNQGEPFNRMCPSTYESGQRPTYTGCAATAMAQVMNYHKWPLETKAELPAYTTNIYAFQLPAIPAGTTVSWGNMQSSYGQNDLDGQYYEYTDDQANAVAQLMLLCGQSLKMDYGYEADGGSGADSYSLEPALIDYFDYEEETVKTVDRIDFSYEEWQNVIYSELAAQRPVIYTGQSVGGGHAFVCDGYDTDDFFHINWGWSGRSDGYFLLSLLNPYEQGAGGSTTDEGFRYVQSVIIGIQKNDGQTKPKKDESDYLEAFQLLINQTSVTRTSATDNFSLAGMLELRISNPTNDNPKKADLGVQIQDMAGHVVQRMEPVSAFWTNVDFEQGFLLTLKGADIPAFGAGLANGTYKMVFTFHYPGDSEWYPLSYERYNHLDIVIDDNTLIILDQSPKLSLTGQVTGTMKVNEEQTVSLQVTNSSNRPFRFDLIYQLTGSTDWKIAAFVEVGANETVPVEFKIVPVSGGENTLQIYSYRPFTKVGDVVFNISGDSGAKAGCEAVLFVTPWPTYDSEIQHYYIDGNKVSFSYVLYAAGTSDYQGKIKMQEMGHSKSSGQWIPLGNPVEKNIKLKKDLGQEWVETNINMVNNTDIDYYDNWLYYWDYGTSDWVKIYAFTDYFYGGHYDIGFEFRGEPATGISNVQQNSVQPTVEYGLDGRKATGKGLRIMRMSDGTVRKVVR